MTAPLSIAATCVAGLEPILLDEVIAALGPAASEPTVEPGAVAMTGDAALLVRANLELGVATHVLVRVGELRARAFPELVRKADKIDWRAWLRPGVRVDVVATAKRSRLYHTDAIAERIAKVVTEQLGPAPEDAPAVSVVARMHRDVCTLSLNTSGEPLHRRGWRQQTAKAPLREDLARALIRLSGWDPSTPFVDPMMGAGTLLIEAATMARGLAPGRLRDFSVVHTQLADDAAVSVQRRLLQSGASGKAPAPIVGRDRAEGALRATIGNATRAGVEADLDLAVADLRETALPSLATGAVVTNPPYGKRVRTSTDVRGLFARLGERIRELGPDWRAAIISPDARTVAAAGLGLVPRVTTKHGGLRVHMFASPSPD